MLDSIYWTNVNKVKEKTTQTQENIDRLQAKSTNGSEPGLDVIRVAELKTTTKN